MEPQATKLQVKSTATKTLNREGSNKEETVYRKIGIAWLNFQFCQQPDAVGQFD